MRNFGIELEFVSPRLTIHRMAEIIEDETGQSIKVCGYYDKTNKWRLKSDSSISGINGMEFVTPILKSQEDLDKVKTIAQVIEKHGGKINRSCGFHVHIDVTDSGEKPLRRLMKYLLKYENGIKNLISESRRHNSYCTSARSYIGHDSLWKSFLELDNKSTRKLIRGSAFRERNGKWNFQNYWEHGSFENRAHQGTLNAEKIQKWVDLTQAIISSAFDHIGTRIKRDDIFTTYTTKDFLSDLVKKGLIDNPTKSYFLTRAEELA